MHVSDVSDARGWLVVRLLFPSYFIFYSVLVLFKMPGKRPSSSSASSSLKRAWKGMWGPSTMLANQRWPQQHQCPLDRVLLATAYKDADLLSMYHACLFPSSESKQEGGTFLHEVHGWSYLQLCNTDNSNCWLLQEISSEDSFYEKLQQFQGFGITCSIWGCHSSC